MVQTVPAVKAAVVGVAVSTPRFVSIRLSVVRAQKCHLRQIPAVAVAFAVAVAVELYL
jgi:hypothetical protein